MGVRFVGVSHGEFYGGFRVFYVLFSISYSGGMDGWMDGKEVTFFEYLGMMTIIKMIQ